MNTLDSIILKHSNEDEAKALYKELDAIFKKAFVKESFKYTSLKDSRIYEEKPAEYNEELTRAMLEDFNMYIDKDIKDSSITRNNTAKLNILLMTAQKITNMSQKKYNNYSRDKIEKFKNIFFDAYRSLLTDLEDFESDYAEFKSLMDICFKYHLRILKLCKYITANLWFKEVERLGNDIDKSLYDLLMTMISAYCYLDEKDKDSVFLGYTISVALDSINDR